MKKGLIVLGLLFLGLVLGAEDSGSTGSDDDLFSGDGVTVQTENPDTDPQKALTSNQASTTIRWGGSFSSDFGWAGGWSPLPSGALSQGWIDTVTVSAKANMFLVAKPDDDVTYKIRLDTSYPFATGVTYVSGVSYKNPAVPTDGLQVTEGKVTVPDLKIWELYADFPVIKDHVDARFGKQMLSWGASRFYSPGDLMAYTAKNATDLNADREGPAALELRWHLTNLPKGIQTAGVKAYLLAKEDYFPSGQSPTYRELGYALQGEIGFGNSEITLGGFYQQSLAPKGVVTWKQGIGQVNFFSEGVVSYGADKKFLEDDGSVFSPTPFHPGYKAISKKTDLFFSGTAGLSYANDNWSKFSIYAEYFYNGLGSGDKQFVEKAYTLFGLGEMGASDLSNPGIHNASASISFNEVAGSDKLNFSTLWQGNFSDSSGWVYPYLTWKPNDYIKFTGGARYAYGDKNTQYPVSIGLMSGVIPTTGLNMESRLSFVLSASLGTGKF